MRGRVWGGGMSLVTALQLLGVAALLVYLVVALVRPDRF